MKDGKLVRGTGDGYLLALDGKTGKELWSRQIAKPSEGHFISMPPLIYEDLVLIGPAGSEFASKGWVGAFRLSNGEPVWKFNTVPDPGKPGAETWGGDPNTLKHGGVRSLGQRARLADRVRRRHRRDTLAPSVQQADDRRRSRHRR
jgi:alcohol dehydrogenase (cytochrome c)